MKGPNDWTEFKATRASIQKFLFNAAVIFWQGFEINLEIFRILKLANLKTSERGNFAENLLLIPSSPSQLIVFFSDLRNKFFTVSSNFIIRLSYQRIAAIHLYSLIISLLFLSSPHGARYYFQSFVFSLYIIF